MNVIIGTTHNDVLFYETKIKNACEQVILNRFHVIVGTIYNEEVMIVSEVYTSYLITSLLSYLIDKYFVLLVICVGRCQAFSSDLKAGQIIISKNTIFGDVNQIGTVKNTSLGQIPGFDRFIESDLYLIQTMHNIFERVGLDTAKDATIISGSNSHQTSEQVVELAKEKINTKRSDEIAKSQINLLAPTIVADSDTGGVALACSLFGIPYISVKVVEGRSGENVPLDTYLRVLKQYSFVGKAVVSFIGEISRSDVEEMEDSYNVQE